MKGLGVNEFDTGLVLQVISDTDFEYDIVEGDHVHVAFEDGTFLQGVRVEHFYENRHGMDVASTDGRTVSCFFPYSDFYNVSDIEKA